MGLLKPDSVGQCGQRWPQVSAAVLATRGPLVEVWTRAGLMTYDVLTFMRVASRNVCIAGVTLSPDG